MERINKIYKKDERLVIGLMSGTSVDGIDAALVKIKGKGFNTNVELIEFENFQYTNNIRNKIFELFNPETGTVDKICHMNFLLGELFANAALKIIKKAGLSSTEIDLIGSHGQTVYHIPEAIIDSGYSIKSTLQIGEPAVIAERTGIVTVADFRVRDVAAGGQGAPLVPYTEYLLFREKDKTIVLQNIGGIANVTVLPDGCELEDVIAFDNGPGNMIIDEVVKRLTDGKIKYDDGGIISRKGKVNEALLEELLEDEYFKKEPPKTTGREYFGIHYVDELLKKAKKYRLDMYDLIATATALTAKSIAISYKEFIIPKYGLDRVIIGGGGSYNRTLVKMINEYLDGIEVLTQEDIGLNSDAKEAIAFAILANEAVNGICNNVPKATGASHPVVMGKISL
ncbi:anhydro-N-acetylmuramic acid kinase [Thermoanaerobacterium thermosaccharolyticum]|uniref:anhydro-N-acetylmuramic acid kinase n=1 Tax=Thermoanaerobacterium thermosaccharolyticum TaxID=1517 RepID=UPI0020A5788E|nr:anhydro-N-acetylmuramic acid kinase [Thermoanaerobacterium thermosaccharolyticum]MCP2241019.1 anhydro-N-acetylmuramic acid kinase [Thermoanaerobacterium thermosaccharolyticum]